MSEPRDRLSRVKDYLEIAAIVVAGSWALWTFEFKEVLQPLRAPHHLNITARLRPVGVRNTLLAVEVSASFTNQSSRTVYVPAAAMLLEGVKIERFKTTPGGFADEMNRRFAQPKAEEFSRSFAITKLAGDVLGTGSLLENWRLGPNESVSRERVMYLEPAAYDHVVLSVHVLEASVSKLDATFRLTGADLFPMLYSASPAHHKVAFGTKEYDALRTEMGFEYSFVTTALSLWPPERLRGQIEGDSDRRAGAEP